MSWFRFGIRQAGTMALVSVALTLAPTLSAFAGTDLLELPARKSQKATRALLTDIGRAGNRLVAVGERGIIVYSDNEGSSWKQADVPVSVNLTAVFFPSLKNGWVVGHDGVILASSDGGTTWVKQFDGNQANALVVAEAQMRLKTIRAMADQAQGEAKKQATAAVQKARDRLLDAEAGAKFGASRPLLGIRFKNDVEGFAVGSYGQIFRTRDGGRHWDYWGGHLSNPDSFHFNALIQTPAGNLVIVGEAGKVYRSLDGGASWETVDTGNKGQFYGVVGLKDQDNQGILVAFGFAGRIYRSVDEGKSWAEVRDKAGKTLVGGAVLADGTLVLTNVEGKILRSNDQGKSFNVAGKGLRTPVVSMALTANGKLALSGVGGVRFVSTTGEGK